ncbi:MAG: hypothetical protein H6916_11740 [Novosphingobium sp.]|uniref:hypothetical protein n=1 Tax=Novosphingobium sp. TaxID=1874826 RepID=UPI001D5372E0|nr:hypothetical protein [Novosphingobium sp.]MCB2058203.1 hypothetical protein [Novosphingobium sp.]MCP5387466.1 hypothetical protein [Novosphingobium sp.]
MAGWTIWGGALLLYALFRLWYDNWRGPLSTAEIDAFMAEVRGRFSGSNDPAVLRAFLEADDGKEFVMLNLVKVAQGKVADPVTGELVDGSTMMRRYSDPFVRRLLRRGGHPGMVGRKVGPYVDAWNVEADPGWSLFGLMRYRSRRDMIAMVRDPLFAEVHPYKLLGIPTTFSFPTQRQVSFYLGPRVWVALVLALGAALLQLAA